MKNKKKIYRAKPNTWFDEGTEVKLVDDYRPKLPCGLFCGLQDGKLDEEICSFNEFKIIEEE